VNLIGGKYFPPEYSESKKDIEDDGSFLMTGGAQCLLKACVQYSHCFTPFGDYQTAEGR